ncbi:hypothetical protein RA955_04070 [Geobacillus proteiniphilus]|uniref:Uncharacterized protein n=1 Tax=Geobacillus proteiniphilus TaxID=860353 RepID=A0A1Q5SH58_9BACL|nr:MULTISPECIES: hypothetical protein [Geobacillus]OKO87332.1 hypothetical protein BRO54_3865 [Geobacillus proteiniphilus]WMJ17293.1 hypothetical protein RA955_04070 [Geobacillus proteiniphilus]
MTARIQALSEAEPATGAQTSPEPADSSPTGEPSASQPTETTAASDAPSGQAIAANDAAVPASSGQTATEASSPASSQPVDEDQEELDEKLARQPIFDVERDAVGYEVFYRSGKRNFYDGLNGDHATLEVLINSFMNIGIEKLTNGKPCFVNFTEKLPE